MSKQITVGDIIKIICLCQKDGYAEDAQRWYAEILDDGSVDIEDWPESKDYSLLKPYFVGWNIDETYNIEDSEFDEVHDVYAKHLDNFDIDELVTNPNIKSLNSIKDNISKSVNEVFGCDREEEGQLREIGYNQIRKIDFED